MPDLLMIVPSRGRPNNIAALHDAWTAATTGDTRLLVAVDDDDQALDGYRQVCTRRGIDLTVGPRMRMCPTLSKIAVEQAPRHFAIGFLGDDHRPKTRSWDERYVQALRELGTGFVYGNDLLAGERLPTEVAVTSDIVMVLGWMVPPGILHMWADNVWLDLGRAIGRITYLPDVIVEHAHYLNGKAAKDAGYTEVNDPAAFEADRLAYAHWLEHDMSGDVAKLKALLR